MECRARASQPNIGSVATITGNPPNMLVASYSGIHYRTFAWHLAPVAIFGLGIDFVLLGVLYGSELRGVLPAAPIAFLGQ